MDAEIDGIVRSVKVDKGSVIMKGMLLTFLDDTGHVHEVIRAKVREEAPGWLRTRGPARIT